MKRIIILSFALLPTLLLGQNITAMTYNIRLDTQNDGDNQWANRKNFLISQVKFYEPMVMGVQEALPNQMDYLNNVLKEYSSIGVGRDDGKRKGEFSAIFYQPEHLKLLDSDTFWLSITPHQVSKGWDAALPRICTWAVFKIRGTRKKIMVMNTHFDHVGTVARQKSLELMLAKSKDLNQKDLPLIIMGDLNLEPDSGPIQWISAKLNDSRVIAANNALGPEGTFNGWKVGEAVTRRIDYIFISDKLKLNKYAVFSDFVNLKYASDHFPVFVDLTIN